MRAPPPPPILGQDNCADGAEYGGRPTEGKRVEAVLGWVGGPVCDGVGSYSRWRRGGSVNGVTVGSYVLHGTVSPIVCYSYVQFS